MTLNQTCFYCGNDFHFHKIRRNGNVTDTKKKTHDPCASCASYMEEGVIIVSILDQDVGKLFPRRTGVWVVVADKDLSDVFNLETTVFMIENRFVFVPDSVCQNLKLPYTSEWRNKDDTDQEGTSEGDDEG